MFHLFRPMLATVLLACLPAAESQGDTGSGAAPPDDAVEPPPPALVAIDEPQRELALPLSEAVLEALRLRRWDRAAELLEQRSIDGFTGAQKGDWAFLKAWCYVHGDQPGEALDLLPLLESSSSAPPAYVALVKGEALLGADQPLEALEALAAVDEGSVVWPRAALQRAEALHALKRSSEAVAIYESIVARPDPEEGNPEALVGLAERRGIGSPEALPLLERFWAHYPTHELSERVAAHLRKYPSHEMSLASVSLRAEALMYARRYDTALALTSGRQPAAEDRSATACRLLYVRGRSYYKKNQLSNAVSGFGDIGKRCTEVEIDYGPRGLYLTGTAQFRRKRYQASADAYRLLADAYGDHSMADDALTRGGISLQEAGKLGEARQWWEEGLDQHPDGDTVPEATWRLAFSLYLDRKPGEAIGIAERLGSLPEAGNATHVQAGRYWAARWLAYPDVDDPRRLTPDAEAREAAVEQLAALCRDTPHSFYAILAYNRLQELDPQVAAELADRPDDHQTGERRVPWQVRPTFADHPGIVAGVALARVGLIREAQAEWARFEEELAADEKAWLTELRVATDDWLLAHDDLRDWIHEHPLGTLGEREPQIVRLAYPDRYWPEVQAAVAERYRYEPRLFHGLVREESNFNRRIVSFAGARGLSQLMPATARQTAGWLDMQITMDDLEDPKTNLRIGAKYLDVMHKQLADSPYLALAAYNGGAGNVNKWIGRHGNLPTDEYVEKIPYRETRGYVKRVMGTWQTYRHRFDTDRPVFADLSAYNHHAKPER